MLVNDGGEPPAVPDGFPLPVVRVDLAESRGRAGAAEAGIAAATGDYVAFLDDDDLAAPEHLATLAGLVSAAGVRVAYTDAAVALYELRRGTAGSAASAASPTAATSIRDVLLVDNYIPFNTLLIERALFAEAGPFDPVAAVLRGLGLPDPPLRRSPRSITCAQVTCEYRHFRGGGHHIFGERPRERADFLEVKARVLAKHAGRLAPRTAGPRRGHPARRAGRRARGSGPAPARDARAPLAATAISPPSPRTMQALPASASSGRSAITP